MGRGEFFGIDLVAGTKTNEIVFRVMTCADGHDFFLELFLVNCKHPSGTDLIYWPDQVSDLPRGGEPTAEEIAELALRGQAETRVGP